MTISASTRASNFGYYFIDSVEGVWNSGRDEDPNLGYKPRYKEGYFPVPPHRLPAGPAQRDGDEPARPGDRHRDPPPRGGYRRPGGDRHEIWHPDQDGRQLHALQVHHQERRPAPQQGGYLHAQAALPGQRLRHAHPPVPVEGWATTCSSTPTATP